MDVLKILKDFCSLKDDVWMQKWFWKYEKFEKDIFESKKLMELMLQLSKMIKHEWWSKCIIKIRSRIYDFLNQNFPNIKRWWIRRL